MSLSSNWAVIAAYLMSHGYTPVATAGIIGNMEQESGLDPEAVGSGGGGLIGFTPLPPGYVTGDPKRDMQTQLAAVVRYNDAQGRLLVARLNQARTPQEAAILYQNDFERPAPATENQANRVNSAVDAYKRITNTQGFNPLNLGNFLEQALTGSDWLNPSGTAQAIVKGGSLVPNLGNDLARVGKYALAAGLVGVGVYFIGRRENVLPAASTIAKAVK